MAEFIPPWHIRPYQPGDETELVPLYAHCFGKTISAAYYRWKLCQHQASFVNTFVAVDGERIVGHYSAMVARIWLERQEQAVLVSVDTMVDPAYRRQGMMTRMATEAYRYWGEQGVPFITGIPNEQWGSRKQAVGWLSFAELIWRVRVFRPGVVLARRAKPPFWRGLGVLDGVWNGWWDGFAAAASSPLTVTPVTQAGAVFDHLWHAVREVFPVTFVRDAAWVQWRYLSHPERPYTVLLAQHGDEPTGYVAYRLQPSPGGQAGFIAELFCRPDDTATMQALLRQVIQHLRQAGAEAGFALISPGTPLVKQLQRHGFILGWGGNFELSLIPLREGLPLVQLRDPAQWFVAGGDQDVI